MEYDNKQTEFKQMFSNYCNGQIEQGYCGENDCEFCCVNHAWERIFESECEELEEEDWE